MLSEIKITGIAIIDAAPNEIGLRQLALFDFAYAGLQINGSLLMKTERDGFTVQLPRKNKDSALRAIKITDSALRHRVTMAARDAYRALGGAHWQWTPFDQRAAA